MIDNLLKTLMGIVIVTFGIVGANTLQYRLAVSRQAPQEQITPNMPDFVSPSDEDYKLDGTKLHPVIRLEDTNGEFFCSGTVISDDYVLTAAHCLTQETSAKLRTAKLNVVADTGEKVEAQAAASNSRADYGLVKGNFKGFSKLRLQTDPRRDLMYNTEVQALVSCGFPWGAQITCYQLLDLNKYYEGLSAKGQMYPGMSGGPVLDPQTGEVYAVNHGISNGAVVIMPVIGLFETLGVKVK